MRLKKELVEMIIFSFICTIGNFVNSTILIIAIAFYLFALVSSKNKLEANFCMALYLVSNIRILDEIGVTYLVNILLAIPLVLYILNNRFVVIKKIFLFTLILFILEMFHIFFLGNISNLIPTISVFVGMLYCSSITCDNRFNCNFSEIWLFFSTGIIMSAVTYLINNIEYARDIVSNVVLGRRFIAYAGEPNYFALYICLALSAVFVIHKFRLIHYVYMMALLGIGVMTASKACILLMFCILGMGFLKSLKESANIEKRNFLIFSIVFMIIFLFIFQEQIVIFYENFLKRAGLTEGSLNMNKFTSGRSKILNDYFSILKSDWKAIIFGYGLQYNLFFRMDFVAHNTYMDIFLSWGLIGLALFSIMIIYIFKTGIAHFSRPRNLWGYISIICLMINFLTLSCLNATMFWWVTTFAFMSLRLKRKELMLEE